MKHACAIAIALAALFCGGSAFARSATTDAGAVRFLGCAYSASQAEGFAEYWNEVTPENAGKWGSVEAVRGRMDWTALDAAYDFAQTHHFPFELHLLVWAKQQPTWLQQLPPAEQRRAIERWFAAVAARYPDLQYVQVVNEPLHHLPDYANALGGAGASGWRWVIEAFRLARRDFPHARLLINDYSIINDRAATRRYLELIHLLQHQHLIDGIGLQAHAFSTHGVPLTLLRSNLDKLATAGLPIYITELDIDGPTDAAQLAEYQRVFPLFWQDPAVRGVTLWGFRPGLWREKERAYLVRRDGSPRPALTWLHEYVKSTAHTR